MIDRYIFQLKSLEPNLRREAIIALSKSGDSRAIGPLQQIAANDPDPELRALASAGEQQVQREQGFVISADPPAPKGDLLSQAMPGRRIEPTEKDKRLAQRQLHQAFSYRSDGKTDHALYHLAQAIQLNPLLVYDKSVPTLASDLMDSGDSTQQAMTVLLNRINSGDLEKPPLPILEEPDRYAVSRAAITSVFLLLLLIGIFTRLSGQPLSLNSLLLVLPQAALGLLSVIIGNLGAFVIAELFGGASTFPRFLNAILTGQLPVFALILIISLLLPAVQLTTIATPSGVQTIATINLLTLSAGFSVGVFCETIFVFREMKFTADKAMFSVIMGMVIATLAAVIFGILRNVQIG